MRYTIGTKYAPCTLQIMLRASRPMSVRIQAYDTRYKNTFLCNMVVNLAADHDELVNVPMPLTPKICGLAIFDEEKGDSAATNNFKVLSIKKRSLKRYADIVQLDKSKVRNFVKFAQRFCYNAGWLPTNKENETYTSDDGQFKIKYLDVLLNPSGAPAITPARINKDTMVIEVSKKHFVDMTVPERFIIMCHEFCHMYINDVAANEKEADLNGLRIYLGLGYPQEEALEIFIKTFLPVPTPDNIDRFRHIENYINRFNQYFKTNKQPVTMNPFSMAA